MFVDDFIFSPETQTLNKLVKMMVTLTWEMDYVRWRCDWFRTGPRTEILFRCSRQLELSLLWTGVGCYCQHTVWQWKYLHVIVNNDFPADPEPLNFFRLFVGDSMLDLLIAQTNLYTRWKIESDGDQMWLCVFLIWILTWIIPAYSWQGRHRCLWLHVLLWLCGSLQYYVMTK